MSTPPSSAADPNEIAKFNQAEQDWWSERGEFALLHHLNPVRLGWVRQQAQQAGFALRAAKVLDVGCGGGILCEALAREGAEVTGLDMSPQALEQARQHAAMASLKIEYRQSTVEALAAERPGSYTIITCMEMLEHTADPAGVIRALARLAAPGALIALSTLNRTPKAFALAILMAEFVLRLLPAGTHDFRRFIRPSELSALLRAAQLQPVALAGLRYNPITRNANLTASPAVNYLMAATRPRA